MLDYEKRLNDAWKQIPTHRQKDILEELEHKAYCQDFSPKPIDNTSEQSESYPNDNLAELIAEGVIKSAEYLVNAISGIYVVYKLIKIKKSSK